MSSHKIEDGYLKIDFQAIIQDLDEEQLQEVIDYVSWERILDSLDHHLKGNSGFDSWSTSGMRGGHKIREYIEKMQGTKDERIKDLESRIQSLEHTEKHLQQYYDWYFRSYHHNHEYHTRLEQAIGTPKEPKRAVELDN